MTIVAEEYGHVVGVDTHAKTHTYAIVDTSTSVCAATEAFPTTAELETLALAKKPAPVRMIDTAWNPGPAKALHRGNEEREPEVFT